MHFVIWYYHDYILNLIFFSRIFSLKIFPGENMNINKKCSVNKKGSLIKNVCK